MAKMIPDQLMNSILGGLYDTLTGGDDSVMRSNNNFFSWRTPGVPYPEQNLEFISRGLINSLDEPGSAVTTVNDNTTNASKEAPDLIIQAEDLSVLSDFIPDITGISNGKRRMNTYVDSSSGKRLSSIYKFILENAQVAQSKPNPELEAKIKRAKSLLHTTEKQIVIDPNTFEEVEQEVPKDTTISRLYEHYKKKYDHAAEDFYHKRKNAILKVSKEAVLDFRLNGHRYRRNVSDAMSKWVSRGNKRLVESINAFIDQVSLSGDLNLLMKDYRSDYENAIVNNELFNSSFLFTRLVPAGFQNQSWTTYEWNTKTYAHHYDRTKTSWGGKGNHGIGGFRIGGGISNETIEINKNIDWESFSMSVELVEVNLRRSWFHPEMLESRYWRFHPNVTSTGQEDILSTGGSSPSGLLPCYPVSFVFARNLQLAFKKKSRKYDHLNKVIKGKAGLSLGPFFIGGKYKKAQKEIDYEIESSEEGISAPGMQLIGARCHMITKKSPNPVDGVEFA